MKKITLVAGFCLSLAFTFGCSGGDDHNDGGNNSSSSLSDQSKDFANANFSVSRYEKAMNALYNSVYPDNLKNLYGAERESYCKAFYGNSNFVESCVKNFGINAGEKPNDNTPLYDNEAFYKIIANENFILGWVDVVQNDNVEANLNQEYPIYIKLGTSKNYDEYVTIRKKAKMLD